MSGCIHQWRQPPYPTKMTDIFSFIKSERDLPLPLLFLPKLADNIRFQIRAFGDPIFDRLST